MKSVIYILLTIFVVKFSMADNSELPTYDQAEKLVEAAWKSPLRSIDITYYLALIDERKTEENLLQIYEEAYENMFGPDEILNSFMLESKERSKKNFLDYQSSQKQQGGKKIKKRVRFDGKSYRLEKSYGSPDRTILKANGEEKTQPGKKLIANTPFEETYIDTVSETGDFERYSYFRESKNARVQKLEHSPAISFVHDDISEILGNPDTSIIQLMLGTKKDNLATEPYDVNELKIKKLCSGTLEGCSVKISER